MHTLSHEADDFIGNAAFHQILTQAGGAGSALFAVSIEPGAGYGRVPYPSLFLHKEPAGGGGGCHFAGHVQAGHAHGIVAGIRLKLLGGGLDGGLGGHLLYAFSVMGLCPVCQHIFALKSFLMGEFFSALRHQQAVDLFMA